MRGTTGFGSGTHATLAIAAAFTVVAAIATACGVSTGPDAPASNQSTRASAKAAPFPNVPIPADAHQLGMWSPLANWPLIAAHAVLIPDGRVLTYGTDGTGQQTAYFIYDVWDSNAGLGGGHMTLPNGTQVDMFCGSQLVLPQSGDVLMAGGDNWTGTSTSNTGNDSSTLFNYQSNSLTRGNNMNRPRWYATATTLLNGETYIQGGVGGRERPEIRATDGNFRLLDGAQTNTLDYWYPRNFVAPDGRVFGFESDGEMYYIDPSGAGSVTMAGLLPAANIGKDATAAMFRPGRILQAGGASNGAVIIDITRGGTPVVTPTQPMASQRRIASATVLPNGHVVVTGGSRVFNELIDASTVAEIWNPDSGNWLQGASGALARLYHSSALLLPDASVLVAGGGAPGPLKNLNAEIYYPPYLFAAGGVLAARPAITAAPATLDIGRTFEMETNSAASIARVTLVKTGSATHGWDMGQLFVELNFTVAGTRLAVQAPTRAADASPGSYLLFVIDTAGVPSVASMVRINVASDPNPAVTPTLNDVINQATTVGTAVTLQLVASDPNGDVLTYFASGLPPGLSLSATTGQISGTATTPGSYNVNVSASDGVNTAARSFVWAVIVDGELSIVVPPQVPVASGTTATFTATSVGVNPQFKWSFGDGSADSEWSSSPTITHVYARPGSFLLTVSVRDDRGLTNRKSFLQRIGLPVPATGARSASSSTLVLEPRAGANARVWVVNQDNDSVSVFDAVTRAKVAEIAVGVAPRSIARSQDGTLWVTNLRSASISVINAATLTVARTIGLPRASQPYGVVFAPAGVNFAYVTLSATGQVIKIDAATSQSVAAANVGAHPRHLALANDGAQLYVSRFITPPLPGEHTATVVTDGPVGGEVVELNATTMGVTRVIMLAHSELPDEENQGRGVPNYLGAAAVSPDASQMWIPSKQDNVKRGSLRDGKGLDFQNTVRAISSRVVLASGIEDIASRVDHDDASVASAAVFDPSGVYLLVALETSREVAVVDAHGRFELFRFDVGRAPQGLALSADGTTLYVDNFMDRTLGVFDLGPLLISGQPTVPAIATLPAVGAEKLAPQVLRGKQMFFDARDPRLARDSYLSCASCHNDGGHDGRVWDMTNLGEGLRNTMSLRGRGAAGQGFLHWSSNFDELQDFESQIRTLSGGTGLMSDADFNAGTRNQPLGDRKSAVSADLDALAAYVASLGAFDDSPWRTANGELTAAGAKGRDLFTALNCGACHAGRAFTGSGNNTPIDIGTIKQSSGARLNGALSGIDIPTLRDVWATAPYLHDGSAPTLESAVRAHRGTTVSDEDAASLAAFLREVGREEEAAPSNAASGTGLRGRYYNNTTLAGNIVLARVEPVDFAWAGAPGPGVNASGFSVRWTGLIEAPATGSYRLQTISNDGIRVSVNGRRVIDNWTQHPATTDTSATVNLVGGQWSSIVVEYFNNGSGAEARLRWQTPGNPGFVAVPRERLFTY